MTVFKEMDPEDVLRALEGHTDILSEESARYEKLYRSKKCHRGCGDLTKEFHPSHVFSDGNAAIGRALMRCSVCKYLMDPFTDITLEIGDPSKVRS